MSQPAPKRDVPMIAVPAYAVANEPKPTIQPDREATKAARERDHTVMVEDAPKDVAPAPEKANPAEDERVKLSYKVDRNLKRMFYAVCVIKDESPDHRISRLMEQDVKSHISAWTSHAT